MKEKNDVLNEKDIIHTTLSLLPLLNRKVVYPYKPELPPDVTNGQFQVLLTISAERPIRMQDLAKFLGLTKQQLNSHVKALEKNGYVLRITDLSNRNIVRADLTDRGIQLMDEIDKDLFKKIKPAFNCFSEEEKKDFLQKMKEVKEYLNRI